MPNAKRILTAAVAALALAACSKGDHQNADANIAIDNGMPTSAGNADIETLPADESSATSSTELQNGIDAPETNETATNAM